MIKSFFRKMWLLLSFPIRYSIRYELLKLPTLHRQNIGMVLQRRATEAAADYVEKHMKNVDSTTSNLALLTMAMIKADLKKDKLICEFGVFSGSTINHIASHTKQPVYGFDSFEGLPERWRDGFLKGAFAMNSLPKVQPNVVLIKAWFEDTLPSFINDHQESIGFLHIDCDLYSSTKTIFDLLSDRIHPGCIIVFDEYFNYPGWEEGEYKAFHEFLERADLKYEYIGYNRNQEQVAVKIMSS